ncbi:hypothetical protein [Ekhidna sp.]|uniref:hypothetical protein n=1 Tax=Ekhidna sp. TaxID=2608089 RepID=UPI003C79EAA8
MKIAVALISCFIWLQSYAQNDSTKTQGEILTGEVVVEKDKKITLPQADKIFLSSTPESFTNKAIQLSFDIKEPDFDWPDYKSDVPFQYADDPYPLADYQNYVKLGYGNFNSPVVGAGLFRKLGNWDGRAKLFYESFKTGPVNEENSGNSVAGIDVSATHVKNNFTVTPTISFKQRQYKFYGNSNRINSGFLEADPVESKHNHIFSEIALSWEKGDINLSFKPHISSSVQSFDPSSAENSETTLGATGSLAYKIDEAFTTGFEIEGQSAKYDGGLAYDRSLININPWVKHQKDALIIEAGFMVSSGKVDAATKTSFYPKAKVSYSFSDEWGVYGLILGGQAWNSLNELLNQNEFLDDSLGITHTENTFSFGGGIKGSPVKNMLVEASLTHSGFKGLPFFIPSASDSARFVLTYDNETVNVISLKTDVKYMPTSTSTYGASLELNGYSVESLDKPWHKPTFVFNAYTSHNIKEKLIVSAYLTSIGGIRAPADVDFGYLKLAAFTDVSLSAKYLITPRASAFIDVNNLLNNEYERYLGYPIRGLAFKIGGQYRF